MSIGSIASILIILGVLIYALWKRANLYLLLAIAIILIFILTVITAVWKPYVQTSLLFWELAFMPAYLATGTNLHTIITSMFVHASLFHLVFNLLALIIIGGILEGRIGTFRLFAIFFITGIIGTLTHTVFHLDISVRFIPIVGASGAIIGLLGALARLYPREKFRLFGILPPISAYVLLGIFLLIDTLLAFVDTGIAHLAHIGGALSGFLIAPLIMRLELKKESAKVRTEGLESLATTPELKDILERVRDEDDVKVREAWLERFFSKISCPQCQKGLKRKRKYLYCEECGWKTEI